MSEKPVMRIRTDVITIYRLFFTLIFLGMGVSGLVAVYLYLEHPDVVRPFLSFEVSRPLWMSIAVGAVLSLICAMLTGSRCLERRQVAVDRRRKQIPIAFPDRRSGIDRRSGEEFRYR